MRALVNITVLLAVVSLSACGGRDESEEPAPADVNQLDPSEATRPTLRATESVGYAPRLRPSDEVRRAQNLEALEGTTWRAGNLVFAFLNEGKVLVRSEVPVADEGVPGTFSYDRGTLTIHVQGRSTAGTWNGQALVIEGARAIQLDQDMALNSGTR